MILLNAHELTYSLPGRTLLDGVNLSLEKGDKVGLIGRNGAGKSTLMRLLTGELTPDSGDVTLRGGTRVAYLEQMPDLSEEAGRTLREVVERGSQELVEAKAQYEKCCEELETEDEEKRRVLEDELDRLTSLLTDHDAWDLETRACTLLTSLGFPDPERKLEKMSGGELKRVAIARALLVPPDILLLDEPTNHLDIVTISWLEQFLTRARFTVLMVTHDRFFLERICSRMMEVLDGKVNSFEGNYSSYLEQKVTREAMAASQQERFDNVLRREQAWLKRGAKARTTKQKARITRAELMMEQKSGQTDNPTQIDSQGWDLGTRRLGKKVVSLNGVEHQVLKKLNFRLEPGERVGLVGSNGSGKTTFLNLLAGISQPSLGQVETGETVQVGYFDQHSDRLQHLPPDTRVVDAVKDVAYTLPLSNGKELTAARLCEMYLFSGKSQATRLEKLSGGERKRLELLRMLMEGPNLILADEPTNDLDIETLQRLEFFLDSFPGCVCIATHDRFLLQRLCDRLLIFRDGVIEEVQPSVLDDIGPDFFTVPLSTP
jgi:ABC transport system ATP-binding/permease protein